MKNTLISLLLLINLQTFSQEYISFPSSNAVWFNYSYEATGSGGNGIRKEHYFILLDETFTIENEEYNKLIFRGYNHYYVNGGLDHSVFHDDIFIGGTRQNISERRVFYYDNEDNQEYLLYDFDLKVGDTLEYAYNMDNDYSLVVLFTDSILLGGEYRKRFQFTNYGEYDLYLIEGIGSTTGLFNWLPNDLHLQCFRHNGESIYPDGETCEVLEINEMMHTHINVYPNPASSYITVCQKSKGLKKIELYDSLGKRVKFVSSNEIISIINVADLNKGIYFLNIKEDGNQVYSEKLIIK